MSGKTKRSRRAATKGEPEVYFVAAEDFRDGLLDDLIDEHTLVIDGSTCGSESRGEGCRIRTPLTDPAEIVATMDYVRSLSNLFVEQEMRGPISLTCEIRRKTADAVEAYLSDPGRKMNWVRLVELDSFLAMRRAWHDFHGNAGLERTYYREWIRFDSWLDDNLKGEAHDYHYEVLYSEDSILNTAIYGAMGSVA